MSLGPRDSALFVIDVSRSMAVPRAFADRASYDVAQGDQYDLAPFDVMRRFVKTKIAQRIMRDLKTTPCGVLLVGHKKTFNCLWIDKKRFEGDEYDRETDPYRHIYELVPMSKIPSADMISKLDQVQAGTYHEAADLCTALTVGVETMNRYAEGVNYKRTLFLLTDGEGESDWEEWDKVADSLADTKTSLVVVGFDFDDEDMDWVQDAKVKSESKAENEHHLRLIIDTLETRHKADQSGIVNARRAIQAVNAPAVKEVKSVPISTFLSFGDVEDDPEGSFRLRIEVKKATMKASARTMKQFSLGGLERTAGRTQRQPEPPENLPMVVGTSKDGVKLATNSQNQPEPGSQSQARSQATSSLPASKPFPTSLGQGGLTLDRFLEENNLVMPQEAIDGLMSHRVQRATEWFYRKWKSKEEKTPEGAKSDSKGKEKVQDEAPTEAKDDDEPEYEDRPVGAGAQLQNAYVFADHYIPVDGFEDGFGELKGDKTGMEIYGFIYTKTFPWHMRIGDVYYVHGAPGEIGSQKALNVLLQGLRESSRIAIVRWVGKATTRDGRLRTPDPRMGVLWPAREAEPDREFAYFVSMPFAEDVRMPDRGAARFFPSFTKRYSRKNGNLLTEHRLIPNRDQKSAMVDFVDAMSLLLPDQDDKKSLAGKDEDDEEDREPKSWFSLEDNFTPSIHVVDQALTYRMTNPDGPLPPPSEHITKYLAPPSFVQERLTKNGMLEKAIKAFDVKQVPPKPKRTGKNTHKTMTAPDTVEQLFAEVSVLAGARAAAEASASSQPSHDKKHHTVMSSDAKPEGVDAATEASKEGDGSPPKRVKHEEEPAAAKEQAATVVPSSEKQNTQAQTAMDLDSEPPTESEDDE